MRLHLTLPVVVLAALVLLAVPATGLASPTPTKNANFCVNCTKANHPGSFHVSSNGGMIDKLVYYNNCARVPATTIPKIPISDGAFELSATVKDVTGAKITYSIKGRFTTPKLVSGTINATGGGHTCKAVPFTAKYVSTGAAAAM
ncbi:MAG: hypothetical protein QOJ22_1293 [Thermoleophilaceae bacterium]|jgi:hypothetical protein|nr:hypothetical protein [Thermoleophilaceae bacterium]